MREDEKLYETEEKLVMRQHVMARLDALVKVWVKRVTQHMQLGEHMINEANSKVFSFGSYRLGVHLPGDEPACVSNLIAASTALLCKQAVQNAVRRVGAEQAVKGVRSRA